jgi:mRNA interferase RelE/StbE
MYKLIVSVRAKHELQKLKRAHQAAIASALHEIKEDPLVGKPLTRELTGRFSFRVGMFRIIYKINTTDKIIYIITAGHRSLVYN